MEHIVFRSCTYSERLVYSNLLADSVGDVRTPTIPFRMRIVQFTDPIVIGNENGSVGFCCIVWTYSRSNLSAGVSYEPRLTVPVIMLSVTYNANYNITSTRVCMDIWLYLRWAEIQFLLSREKNHWGSRCWSLTKYGAYGDNLRRSITSKRKTTDNLGKRVINSFTIFHPNFKRVDERSRGREKLLEWHSRNIVACK